MNKKIKVGLSVVLATLLFSGCNPSENNNEVVSNSENQINNESGTLSSVEELQLKEQRHSNAQQILSSIQFVGDKNAQNIAKIKNVKGIDSVDVDKYISDMLLSSRDTGTISLEEYNELSKQDPDTLLIEIFNSSNSIELENLNKSPQRGFSLTGVLKDGINKLAASDVGQSLGGEAFKLVLGSEGVTVAMLDMARGSRTVTDMMIDILGDKKNWNDLSPKMYNMLSSNQEFGEKFLALADEMDGLDGSPDMGKFFFSMVDSGIYGPFVDSVILSDGSNGHNSDVSNSSLGYLGSLMKKNAKEFFIEPGTGVQTNLNTAAGTKYGTTDAFSTLLFDNGAPITFDENGTEINHGDGSEIQNERLFYSLFRTPSSTKDFISAMEELDSDTVTMFMDQIFLGEQDTIKFGKISDTYQGFYNIISIAGSMNEGVQNYGLSSYLSSFYNFYNLIPVDRFGAYSVAFVNAGMFYTNFNLNSLWGNVKNGYTSVSNELFSDNNNTANHTSSRLKRSSGLGTIDTPWKTIVWDCSVSGWDNLNIWTSLSGMISGEVTETTPKDSFNVMSNCIHSEIELAVREDIVNDSKVDNNVSTDISMSTAETMFILPNFEDITFSYVWEGSKNRALTVSKFFYNDKKEELFDMWKNISFYDVSTKVYEYTNVLIYGTTEEKWAYLPEWLSNTQWLDLKEYYGSTDSSLSVDFSNGYVDLYIVSLDPNLNTTVQGLTQDLEKVDTEDVPLSTKENLNLENISESDITEYYVYKVRIYNTTGLDEMLSMLKDYISGLGADVTNANQ